jgi:hypothetical protein
MTKTLLTMTLLAFASTTAVAEKYPQATTRADALRACNVNSQVRWNNITGGGTPSDYERNRRTDYSACMFARGHVD